LICVAATNAERVGHPTQKPLRVMTWVIANFTREGDTVFDPYMGSGTTGVACVKLGRNFVGYEVDANYFAIAKKRIEDAQLQISLPMFAEAITT
jgi:DNA modification methylase